MPTQNEALLEAYASCPPSARIYYTLEIWQSSFAPPARVVANVGDDMVLGIEPGAPRDGGAMVTFIACPFSAAYPEQREGQPPSTKIKVDNVNRELVPQIRAALGTPEYIQVLYREYLGSDLTEPAYGPIEFELRNAQMVGASLTGTAMVRNLQNKRFPRVNKKLRLLAVSEPPAMTDRAAFLAPLIGEPWAWQSRNCWDFASHVQLELFGRELPRVAVPAELSKRWVVDEIERHPERSAWREAPHGPGGLVAAADGALVLMAHLRFPAHIGVWLAPEARVIHCSEQHGVCCESVLALRQMGWKKPTFYERIS